MSTARCAVLLLVLAPLLGGCCTDSTCRTTVPRVVTTEVVSERCIPLDCHGEPLRAPAPPPCGCVVGSGR